MTEVYYKVRQFTKFDRLSLQSGSGITKCVRVLLQSASGVTTYDSYYKERRNTSQSINLSKNYAISIGTISKFYKRSKMGIVNFLMFFFPCTIVQ